MFQRAIHGQSLPKDLSSDHDPLYRFHRWQANLRVLEVTEIKTVPYVPLAHPFVERLIGTIRREYLDRILFWGTADLEAKLLEFQHYYNAHRTHTSLNGLLPEPGLDGSESPIRIGSYRWQKHCRGLYQSTYAQELAATARLNESPFGAGWIRQCKRSLAVNPGLPDNFSEAGSAF